MTDLAEKKEFNFIMHPTGNGLKYFASKPVLGVLSEYKNNFKKGDTIIFSAYKDKYNENGLDWTKQYSTFIQQTQNIGMKFILISPTPTFSGVKGGYTCQEEWYRRSWAISPLCFSQINKKEWISSNITAIKIIEKFLIANPGVYYIDAFSILCPNNFCKNYDQNELMYKDEIHLSGYGAMRLSNTFETIIRSK